MSWEVLSSFCLLCVSPWIWHIHIRFSRYYFIAATRLCPCNFYNIFVFVFRGLLYSSSIDCLMKCIRQEGFFALYKGFIPIWARMVRIVVDLIPLHVSCEGIKSVQLVLDRAPMDEPLDIRTQDLLHGLNNLNLTISRIIPRWGHRSKVKVAMLKVIFDFLMGWPLQIHIAVSPDVMFWRCDVTWHHCIIWHLWARVLTSGAQCGRARWRSGVFISPETVISV